MKAFRKIPAAAVLCIGAVVPLAGGCGCFPCAQSLYRPPPTPPPGAQSDAMWQRQEANAEASDFVVYQHEFELNGVRLNTFAEDHLRQMAVRLRAGADFPVIVERSMTSVRPESEFKYPVNPGPELDMQRREIVVRSLAAMGVGDAEQRVMVAPPLAAGFKATEALRAYGGGLGHGGQFGAGHGGFGGAFFGGGGGGGGGAF
jgi:uncharacterized membrane protein YgcG